MIRFGINEYIRNFWFHLCAVLILWVMMITSATLISNIDKETEVYCLFKKYVDEDTTFSSLADYETMQTFFSIDGEVHAIEYFDGLFENDKNSYIRTGIYTEEIMKYLPPRLSAGEYPNKVDSNKDMIRVLISENPYGIEVGDSFTYNVYLPNGELLPLSIYVTGMIGEGQRLYTELNETSLEMTYEHFFPIYSYEQTELVRMIILEKEMLKIPELKGKTVFSNIMVNPSNELPEQERMAICEAVDAYEEENFGEIIIPEINELLERSEIKYNSIVLKYLPLCFVVILLFSICIIGIVTIKTAKSTRYYGIMYAYGMQYDTAQWLSGAEMAFNGVLAFVGSVSLITLQNSLQILGKINCNLDVLEVLIMIGICGITVISAIFTTRSILKEKTPVEILKNKV